MVREFLSWWLGQLAEIVPERWRRLGAYEPNLVIVERAGSPGDRDETVALSIRRRGLEAALGEFRLGRDPLPDSIAGNTAVLRLAAADVLDKTLVLPLAAERDIDQVLGFEMDRETPFTADEVFWSGRILRRNRTTGQLSVGLVLVPRARLQRLLTDLDAAGVSPSRACIANGRYRDIWLPLTGTGGRRHVTPRPILRLVLAASLGLLAIIAAIAPFALQSLALASIERSIAGERVAATRTEELRKEIDRLSGGADVIEAEREKVGRPLVVVAALTKLLQADTYLIEFGLQQGKVTLTGRSTAASRLIAEIAADPHLHNPSFAAPVTRTGTDRLEVFTITMEIAP